jgi:TolB-like protein/class 3 adenylate cyclase/Tfp pilus assembly protein PilF
MPQQNRRLAAILFTDIVGSTAIMQKDEQIALSLNKRYVAVLKQYILSHGGEILNDFGDGSLCSFSSATEAMHCAIEIQRELQVEPKVPLRIGLHVGEIFFDDGKAMGDGVNVASRVQSLGVANSILFSSEINTKIKNQPEFKSISLGKFHFKHVDESIEVFALANDGLVIPKKEKMEGKVKGIEKRSKRTKDIIIGGTILLLALAFIAYKLSSNKGFTGEKTIAVLPFENIGAKDTEEYISDGITQDIISKLSKISSLEKVIAWFSVRSFKNTKKSLKQIAGELGVAAILTGTIERNADNVHIITELVEVNTSKRLWGEDYNYSGSDILSIQSNLAGKIASALQASLTPEEKQDLSKHYTENVQAYKFYRKGRSFWDQRTKESYDSAELYYKKAIDLDPDYALAYSGLADCYTFNQKGLSQQEAIPIANQYANKALSLDSTLVEARTTIAFIQSHHDFDFKGSIVLFKKIINDNPNYSVVHRFYSNVLLYLGKIEEALSEEKKALSLDPLSAVENYVLGRHYYFARRYDSAISQLQKNVTLNPKFPSNYIVLGWAYVQKKEYSKAVEAFSNLPMRPFDQGNNGLLYLSFTYAFEGNVAKAKATLAKVSEEDRLICPHAMAYVNVGFGKTEAALSELEQAYNIHDLLMLVLKVDRVLDPLRNEPRFKALMKKMNLE